MSTKYVPFDKMSPKAQKEILRKHRNLWQGIKLCPRVEENKKTYRRKGRRIDREETVYVRRTYER